MTKDILIIGGTAGLGLELAKMYAELGHRVVVTGRHDPEMKNLSFIPFVIDAHPETAATHIDKMLENLPSINTLIYVAGYYQEGHIDVLSDDDILGMTNIGLVVPTLIIRRLKNNPGKPLKIMIVTSSSQYTPRELEPVYTAVKAGLGMLANSLALDPGIGKVLVVAPSGMKTPSFWGTEKDVSAYLEPKWVAEQIIALSSGPFKYKFAKILRGPERVEVIETRET